MRSSLLLLLLAVVGLALSAFAQRDDSLPQPPRGYRATITARGDCTPATTVKLGRIANVAYTARIAANSNAGRRGHVFETVPASKPLRVRVGSGDAVMGLEYGLLGTCEGGKVRITVPPQWGFGPRGHRDVPGDATLDYEVTVVSVTPAPNLFVAIDADTDGYLTEREVRAWLKKQGAPANEINAIARELVRDDDADGDGKVSWDEYSGPKGEDLHVNTNGRRRAARAARVMSTPAADAAAEDDADAGPATPAAELAPVLLAPIEPPTLNTSTTASTSADTSVATIYDFDHPSTSTSTSTDAAAPCNSENNKDGCPADNDEDDNDDDDKEEAEPCTSNCPADEDDDDDDDNNNSPCDDDDDDSCPADDEDNDDDAFALSHDWFLALPTPAPRPVLTRTRHDTLAPVVRALRAARAERAHRDAALLESLGFSEGAARAGALVFL